MKNDVFLRFFFQLVYVIIHPRNAIATWVVQRVSPRLCHLEKGEVLMGIPARVSTGADSAVYAS